MVSRIIKNGIDSNLIEEADRKTDLCTMTKCGNLKTLIFNVYCGGWGFAIFSPLELRLIWISDIYKFGYEKWLHKTYGNLSLLLSLPQDSHFHQVKHPSRHLFSDGQVFRTLHIKTVRLQKEIKQADSQKAVIIVIWCDMVSHDYYFLERVRYGKAKWTVT